MASNVETAVHRDAYRRSVTAKSNIKVLVLLLLSIASCCFLLYYGLDEYSEKTQAYLMTMRQPRLYAIVLASICIGVASIVFQSIIRNAIVTPSILGMGSLYSLVQTSIFFVVGADSFLVYNRNLGFLLNLAVMSVVSLAIYGYLFKKTNYNILYVLLMGTVMSNFFGGITTAMTRVMDPNTYDSLLDNLVASFGRVNGDLLKISTVIILVTLIFFSRELRLLDLITLGKNQAINLGADYDKVVGRLLLCVILLVSVSTALVGPITFLGIIVSNLSRQVFQTYRHIYLLLGSVLFGFIVLAGGQGIIEHVLPFDTYISVIINIVGGSYFLFLIIKNKGA